MATFHRFEDLEILQIAKKLSLKVFMLTEVGPSSRDFKFRDQIRSSAGSVMDNIAEGFERSGQFELVNFLSISKGSSGGYVHNSIEESIKIIFRKTQVNL